MTSWSTKMFPVLRALLRQVCETRRVMSQKEILSALNLLSEQDTS